jgi:hypothetical protein
MSDLQELMDEAVGEYRPASGEEAVQRRVRRRQRTRRAMAIVVALAILAVPGWLVWSALRPGPRPTTALTASDGNYAIDQIEILHRHGPGEPDPNIVAIGFRVRWVGDTFPGVHECTNTAYGTDGTVVGSASDALVSLSAISYASPGGSIAVTGEAVRVEASCSPQRIDEVLAYDVPDATVSGISVAEDGAATASVSYTVGWPDTLAPGEWPSPNTCVANVRNAGGGVVGSSTFSTSPGPSHPTSFEWRVPLTDAAEPSPSDLAASVRCEPFGTGDPQTGSVFFPTSHSNGAVMSALLRDAVLDLRQGCLLGKGYLLVWPDGFTYADGVVHDAEGNVVAAVGRSFSVGGGLVDPSHAEQETGDTIPDACLGGPESVWMVGDVVRAAPATGATGASGPTPPSGPTGSSAPADVLTTREDEDFFEVTYPAGWHVSPSPINDWVCSPYEILALATYPLRPGGQAVTDFQLPSHAIEDLGPNDILIWLNENGSACAGTRDSAGPSGFPDRPTHLGPVQVCGDFDLLCPSDGRGQVPGIRSWWIAFNDAGRSFYVFVGMGEAAYSNPDRQQQAWDVLDSLDFLPR